MLFRLIGKLYFYFCIVPAIGKVLMIVTKMVADYNDNKAADPTWTMEKQRAQDAERRNRRRNRRSH